MSTSQVNPNLQMLITLQWQLVNTKLLGIWNLVLLSGIPVIHAFYHVEYICGTELSLLVVRNFLLKRVFVNELPLYPEREGG